MLAFPLALALALATGLTTDAVAREPIPAAARGRGALAVSGDGRFGLFAGPREFITWELATGKAKQRVRLTSSEWSIAPSPDGEMALLVGTDRLTEVMLLTGRVALDAAAPATSAKAREVAWAADSSQVLTLGWELPELAPGDGTPLAYIDPRLGYVARQIRIPGLVESRGLVVRANGFDVVIATPKRLILLGLGLAAVRTVMLGELAGLRLVAALPDGVLAAHGADLVVLDPERGVVLRRVGPPLADGARLAARPLGRWLVAASDEPAALACVDTTTGGTTWLDPRALGDPRAVLPIASGLVALGREAQAVDLGGGVPTAIVRPGIGP